MLQPESPRRGSLQLSDLPGPDTPAKQDALGRDDPRLAALLAEAARVAWPEAYHDDLYVHDANALDVHPARPLIWVLRRHGTHLLPVECESHQQAEHVRALIRYWGSTAERDKSKAAPLSPLFYLLEGATLNRTDWRRALDSIRVSES